MSRSKILAIDFDGTLFEDEYPKIGAPKRMIIARALIRQKQGAKLILWTCRVDKRLEEAIEACKPYGLIFDAINENLPETIKLFGGDPRKIFADEYWDDRANIC